MASRAKTYMQEELRTLETQLGPYRQPRVLRGEQGHVAVIDGRSVINLTANNYLGLATHPHIKQAAREAVRTYGVSVCSRRDDIGTTDIHVRLEAKVAEFQRTEAAVVLGSNSEANLAVMESVLSADDVAVVDERSHESVIDGISIAGAECRTYRHVDTNSLADTLEALRHKGYRRLLLSTCGVFPRGGNVAPLPRIHSLAAEYGAMTMVDDAHAVGVLGENGRGTASHYGLDSSLDIQTGGFGKALGVTGGYIACSHQLRELIVRKSNVFLHSASPQPATVAACLAALEILQSQEGECLIGKAWENAEFFRVGLKKLGFRIPSDSQTPLVPVVIGDPSQVVLFSNRLFEEGIFVAPKGNLLRVIVSAAHTREELTRTIDAFEKVGKALDLITKRHG